MNHKYIHMKTQHLLILALCLLPLIFFGQKNEGKEEENVGHVQQPGNGITSAGLNAGTSALNSTHFGENAGKNSTGNANTFIGYNTGVSDSALGGVFVGFKAGYSNTTGRMNVIVGDRAGYSNTKGEFNTFLGTVAGYKNTTGSYNTSLGMYSGHYNTKGSRNSFVGYMSGLNNTTGHQNVMLGDRSGYSNKSGYFNTFLGNTSGYFNTEGSANTFLGSGSGYRNSTGGRNVIVGYRAGSFTSTGHDNTIIGNQAGYRLASGSGNLFLGNLAGYYETESNKLYIDNSATSAPLIYGDFSKNELTVNGKLGIGVADPGYPLEVNGAVKLKNGNTDLLIYRDSDVGDWSLLRTNTGNGIGLIGQPDFVALSVSRTTSNVGIGTRDTKGFRLGVKGKIAAEEVKVAIYNNWSDFVFENEYNLPSLKEVEKHINEKGHLKDIPSASEVAKNGIFLGDMNAKLLQKIEELTLYTIQQQKELEAQHQKNKSLEARLEALEVHLKN